MYRHRLRRSVGGEGEAPLRGVALCAGFSGRIPGFAGAGGRSRRGRVMVHVPVEWVTVVALFDSVGGGDGPASRFRTGSPTEVRRRRSLRHVATTSPTITHASSTWARVAGSSSPVSRRRCWMWSFIALTCSVRVVMSDSDWPLAAPTLQPEVADGRDARRSVLARIRPCAAYAWSPEPGSRNATQVTQPLPTGS